ncbi:MAG: lysophospholipid acyltransferase family protein [Rhodanobacter sp.]
MRRVPSPAELPECMPSLRDAPRRALCRLILRGAGWGLDGQFPDVSRLVLIAAPHSSWWDGIWGLLIKVAIGADVRFMGKQELFRPPLAGLLRRLGGMPVDRGATTGVVEQMIEQFNQHGALWLGVAPEGTRQPVAHWKSGFWRIAHGANVPILPVAFDYPSKTIVLGSLLHTSTDLDADIGRLRVFYAPFKGKHRDV